MLALMKKEILGSNGIMILASTLALVLAFLFLSFSAYDNGETRNDIFEYMYLLNGLSIFGMLMGEEKYEEKNHGRELIGTLPVKSSTIVGAKYLSLIVSGCYCTTLVVLLHSFFLSAEIFASLLKMAIVTLAVCLVVAAALYPLIFKYGYSRMMILVVISYILVIGIPLWLRALLERFRTLGFTKQSITLLQQNTNTAVIVVVCCALFAFFYFLGLKQYSSNNS
jgi:hypothetical protein